MKNLKPISISIILIFTLILSLNFAEAIKFKHKIKNLKAVADPKKPDKGTAASLDISFELKSSSGIEKDRIQVYFNSTKQDIAKLPESNFTTTTTSTVNGVEFADVNIILPQVVFSSLVNNLEVLYLVSSISNEPPLASAIKKKKAKPIKQNDSDDNNSGSGGSGGNGGGNTNGDEISLRPELFRMIVEEVNGTGMVSTTPKQFRINLYHDQRILGEVTDNGFNAETNVVLTNLKIFSQNPNDKEDSTRIEDEFSFELEGNGTVTSNLFPNTISNERKTVYISNGKTLTERQNLVFKLDLTKFVEKTEVNLESNIKTKGKDTIEIEAQEINFDTLTFQESQIDFDITKTKKGKLSYDSEEFDIIGTFNSDELVSSVDEVEYFIQDANLEKTKPSIRNSVKLKNKLSPSTNNGTPSVTGNTNDGFSVTIPTTFSLKSTAKTLKKKGFYDSSIKKKVRIPITITAKTDSDLDVIINGTLLQNGTLNFEEVVNNGSSL